MLGKLLFWLACRSGLYNEIKRAISERVRKDQREELAEALETHYRRATKEQERRIRRLESLLALNDRQALETETVRDQLDLDRLAQHLGQRIAEAPIRTDPFPYVVVEDALPEDFYDLLLRALPPAEFFGTDKYKRNFTPTMKVAPRLSRIVWGFVDDRLAPEAITPAVLKKFAPFLDEHYGTIFGRDFQRTARSLPAIAEEGRIMFRPPGYRLEPHLDPTRVLFTVILYLPAAPFGEDFGTQLFRISGEFEATNLGAFYPERHGLACELVATAPYKANHLLVFLNSKAAHGAHIPKDRAPKDFERRAYRFYIRPEPGKLASLVRSLPAQTRAKWGDPDSLASEDTDTVP